MASAGSIVVGVDGSRESLRAAAMAWRIAERAGRRCYPVYAIPDAPAATLIPDLWRGVRVGGFRVGDRNAGARVERALRSVVPRPVADELVARLGRAPIVIADAAHRLEAGLVVLGAARDSRARTAQYLVRRGSSTVMVVRSAARMRLILVAIDGSAASPAALAAAAEYAQVFGARLRAVHVLELLRFPRARNAGWLLEQCKETFDRLLTRNGGIEGSVRPSPSASTGIIAEAAKRRADLVVVTSRRRGRVDRLLLGSTTERLLVDLPTSLLVVRTPRR